MRLEPLPLDPGQWSEAVHALRRTFLKWDGDVDGRSRVPPLALVLERAEHAACVQAAEAIAQAAHAQQQAWLADGADAPRLPDGLERLAASGAAGPYVTRVDLFLTPDGWMASECNDDVPGGYNEAIGLPALLEPHLPAGLSVPGDLPDALARLVGAADGARIGIALATGYAEDLQVAELLRRLWEARGAQVVLGSPAQLATHGHGPALGGTRVERLFRFFPIEWHAGLPRPALEAWRAAAAAGQVTNPFATAWTQHKGSFASLRRHARARPHLPMTHDALEPGAAALARERPGDWVLKPAFGRMGEGVVCGDLASPLEWRKRLAQAARATGPGGMPHVLQRRFRPVPVEAAPGQPRTACVGAYVVGGRFAGYYSRLSAGPVVAYHADNVLTVVEGA